jgi:hypothetical protein
VRKRGEERRCVLVKKRKRGEERRCGAVVAKRVGVVAVTEGESFMIDISAIVR